MHIPHPLRQLASFRRRQTGAALLMAMVIVTLVATMSASMVWQQWRAVQVEGSERVRSQASWVLSGALDWARLILKEDAKAGQDVDHLGEPWAMPLAEARLSTFLAADQDNNASDDEDSPDAFLSGKVEDAESKYNLYNLLERGQNGFVEDINKKEREYLQRLCSNIGMSPSLADGIADAYFRAYVGLQYQLRRRAADLALIGGEQGRAKVPILPRVFDDIAWLGLDAGTVERLRPYVTILMEPTKVNANTASKEVIAAVVPNLDVGRAGRMVQARQRKPFRTGEDIEAVVGRVTQGDLDSLAYTSKFFEVSGRLRYEDNIIEQRHLVHRKDANDVTVLHQSRFSGIDSAVQAASPP